MKQLAVLLFLAGRLLGQSPERTVTLRLAQAVDPLAVLSEVRVFIQPTDKPLNDNGLQQSLQTDTELRLRKAGIKVTNQGTSPTLSILVTSNKRNEEDPFAVFVAASLQQSVMTVPSPSVLVFSASTWRSTFTVAMARGNSDRSLRDIVADKVDEFINAYLAAHAK